jgi:hypothetical protein
MRVVCHPKLCNVCPKAFDSCCNAFVALKYERCKSCVESSGCVGVGYSLPPTFSPTKASKSPTAKPTLIPTKKALEVEIGAHKYAVMGLTDDDDKLADEDLAMPTLPPDTPMPTSTPTNAPTFAPTATPTSYYDFIKNGGYHTQKTKTKHTDARTRHHTHDPTFAPTNTPTSYYDFTQSEGHHTQKTKTKHTDARTPHHTQAQPGAPTNTPTSYYDFIQKKNGY